MTILTNADCGSCSSLLMTWTQIADSNCTRYEWRLHGYGSWDMECPPKTVFDPQRCSCSHAAFVSCSCYTLGETIAANSR